MIEDNGHDGRYVLVADGAKVPLIPVSVTVRLDTVVNGQIMGVSDALAMLNAVAQHWAKRYEEQQTEIADLRAQLTAKG